MKLSVTRHVLVTSALLALATACRLPPIGELPIYKSVELELLGIDMVASGEDGVSLEAHIKATNPNDEPFPVYSETLRFSLEGAPQFETSFSGVRTLPAEDSLEFTLPLAVNTQAPTDGLDYKLEVLFRFSPEGALRQTLRDSGFPRPAARLVETGVADWSLKSAEASQADD